MNLFEKALAFLKTYAREIVFISFIGLSYWMIFGLGQIVGSQIQLDDSMQVAGKKDFAEIVALAEAKQARGRLIISDKTRFKDQFGNYWIVADFHRNVSKRELDKLRSLNVQIDGDVRLETVNASANAKQAAFSAFLDAMGKIILTIFYVLIVYFMFTQIRSAGGGGGFFSKPFKKIERSGAGAAKTTFADVAGQKGPKQEVWEIIDYLKNPDKYAKVGARPPRGVLLYGPPGNGKTLIAKALAGEADASFLEQNASSFMQLFVGMGAQRVRDLFREARKISPCVIFIDEIDSIGAHRGGQGQGGGHDERIQTINALLAELDGFSGNEGIVVVAATNRLEQLDEALVRPGRFDRKVFVPMPGKQDRLEILKTHAAKLPKVLADLSKWSERTQGFSGADLANLVNEAAMEGARENADSVADAHFAKAKDRILMGPRNHGHMLTDREREIIAYHEAGHAALRMLCKMGQLEKVSILPHGTALGVTISASDEERLLMTKDDIEKELMVLMAGRASEEVFIGQITTGAANDMERASQLSRTAITRYGFDAFGPYVPEHAELAKEIELKAGNWVRQCYEKSKAQLRENEAAVKQLAAELLACEEVDGSRAKEIFNL